MSVKSDSAEDSAAAAAAAAAVVVVAVASASAEAYVASASAEAYVAAASAEAYVAAVVFASAASIAVVVAGAYAVLAVAVAASAEACVAAVVVFASAAVAPDDDDDDDAVIVANVAVAVVVVVAVFVSAAADSPFFPPCIERQPGVRLPPASRRFPLLPQAKDRFRAQPDRHSIPSSIGRRRRSDILLPFLPLLVLTLLRTSKLWPRVFRRRSRPTPRRRKFECASRLSPLPRKKHRLFIYNFPWQDVLHFETRWFGTLTAALKKKDATMSTTISQFLFFN